MKEEMEDEEFAYGYLIKILSGGLYPNKLHVIREYIQNAYDAIREYEKITKNIPEKPIQVHIKNQSIFIHDYGTGMNAQSLHEFRKIGFSKKKPEESVGFQGIGKLAGITVAKKLVVTTSLLGLDKKHTLVFDAEGMLNELNKSKAEGKNPTLNDLVKKYTSIDTSDEIKDEHYTFIELKDISKEASILLSEKDIRDYISRHCPVPFDPNFEHGTNIDKRLKLFVPDYGCVNVSVNGKDVFKPYIKNVLAPEYINVTSSDRKIIALCWYCKNKNSEQIEPIEDGGLIYRYKNFRIGDNYLTRSTIWNTSGHLAFWFSGEIHVCNNFVMPTAERNNFQQTKERSIFYEKCRLIADTLNALARGDSKVTNYVRALSGSQEILKQIDNAVKEGGIANEIKDLKVFSLVKIKKDMKRRIDEFEKNGRKIKKQKPINDDIEKGKEVIKKTEELLKQIDTSSKKQIMYDIKEDLKLNEQASFVYSTIISVLKDYFIADTKTFEELVKRIQKKLKIGLK